MIKKVLSPIYLLPFALVSPYLYFGPYGVTLFEALVLVALFVLAAPALLKGSFRLPVFVLAYFALFLLGWLGAVVNGANWGMPVGLFNLNIFYRVALALGGYYVGYCLYQSMDTIVSRRFFHVVLVGLLTLAAAYPFLTYEQRLAIFRVFGETEFYRLHSPRLPGLGINANIYSFMLYVFLLFSFSAYLRKQVSAVVPLLAFVVIVSLSSKSVVSLSVGSCALLLARSSVSVGKTSRFSLGFPKRALKIAAGLLLISVGTFFYLEKTSLGNQVLETVQVFNRFSYALENTAGTSSFEDRAALRRIGMERVALAPVLGIVEDRDLSSDTDVLLFAFPHNEFVSLWMFYGLAGLLAHVVLLGFLLVENWRKRAGLPWMLLYPALLVQMWFDAAFAGVRFQAMFFIIIGINVRYLRQLRSHGLEVQFDQAGVSAIAAHA